MGRDRDGQRQRKAPVEAEIGSDRDSGAKLSRNED